VYGDKYLVNNINNNREQHKENQETNLIFSNRQAKKTAACSPEHNFETNQHNKPFQSQEMCTVYVGLLLGEACHATKAARKAGKVG
jgi:hypothetical protein